MIIKPVIIKHWGNWLGTAIALVASQTLGIGDRAIAQITPDTTLGAESSQLTPNVVVPGGVGDRIEGGALRNTNLFHSFSEFNINDGQRVYFSNPNGIENILSRVTGNDVSDIMGTLGVDGPANLFFLNPNGIIFGPNSRLDIRGSFLATTANAFQFGDQGSFSAVDPQAPPLLTIQPTALWFNQLPHGSIINRSSGFPGLRVGNGESLIMIGGEVRLENGMLTSNNGRIEVGAIAGEGSIELNSGINTLSLGFSPNAERLDIYLDNWSSIFLIGTGNIVANGRDIYISRRSGILTTAEAYITSSTNRAGDIDINATGTVSISNGSSIGSGLINSGQAGNITITGQAVQIVDGIGVASFSVGQGNAGRVVINVNDSISLSGRSSDGTASGILSSVASLSGFTGIGNGGDISLQAQQINLSDGAHISSSNLSAQGNVGNIIVDAREAVSLTNGAQLSSSTFGQGDAGNVTIRAGDRISLTNGARINSTTFGTGDAGNVTIRAGDRISLDGTTPNGRVASGIFSGVGTNAQGNSGNVVVSTGSLSITNGAALSAVTSGRGDAGNVTIRAGDRISLTNGAWLSSSTFGTGNAGDVIIHAGDRISLDSTTPNGQFVSGIFSNVNNSGQGNGGNVVVSTGSLSITNGANLSASTFGRGDGGNVSVRARDRISLDGTTPNGQFVSGIFSNVNNSGQGNGGNVVVSTGSLSITNGAALSASTSGRGDAGNVTIRAGDRILLDNGDIFSNVETSGIGQGGTIDIRAGELQLLSGAQLQTLVRARSRTTPPGESVAGNITIHVTDGGLMLISGVNEDGFPSLLTSELGAGRVGRSGTIEIATGLLSLSNNGRLSTDTRGQGGAGNIAVHATDRVSLTNGAQISSSTLGAGDAGNVTIRAGDRILLDGTTPNGQFASGIFSGVGINAQGNGGNVVVSTGPLSITNGAALSASTSGRGDAGNVTIRAGDRILLDNGDIFSNVESSGVGQGGIIDLRARSLQLLNGSQLQTLVREAEESTRQGYSQAGDIIIHTDDDVTISGQNTQGFSSLLTSTLGTGRIGQSGNIGITAASLTISNTANLRASTSGQGNAGNITINAPDRVLLDRGRISTSIEGTNQQGTLAGNISISTRNLTLNNNSILDAITTAGNGGNLTLNNLDLLLLRNNSQLSTTAGIIGMGGDGGNITIDAGDGFVIAIPSENSDITANAYTGRGGRVEITTQGLLGIEPRDRLTPRSDITASSQFGIDGILTIEQPDIDPNQGLVELPEEVVDASGLIAQSCVSAGEVSEFIITGQGGLSPIPTDPLSNEGILSEWMTLPSAAEVNVSQSVPFEPPNTPVDPIVEAQGWVIRSDGTVTLTAPAPTTIPFTQAPYGVRCHAR